MVSSSSIQELDLSKDLENRRTASSSVQTSSESVDEVELASSCISGVVDRLPRPPAMVVTVVIVVTVLVFVVLCLS
jgi:chorismate synthase